MGIRKLESEHGINNIIDILFWRADVTSNKQAYIYLSNGHIEESTLTYQQLKCRVLEVGAHLQAMGAQGERALLLYPQGLDFLVAFLGCLSTGVVAIPAPAPEAGRLKRALPRLQAIADDAEASIILTNSGIIKTLEKSRSESINLNVLHRVDTNNLSTSVIQEWHVNNIIPSTTAYLQYTSGSTSKPKGVIITHDCLLRHLQCIQVSGGYTSNSVTVTWMPHFHDYGLIEGILVPLFNGTSMLSHVSLSFRKKTTFMA